jgi:glutamate racemase
MVTGAIGVLDSGVGGLSVLRAIHELLPDVSTLYFGDQAHVPYGPRPAQEIRVFVEQISAFLQQQGAQVIVVACHAASAAGLYYLRERFPQVPVVGMEPAVKPAAEATRSGTVGILTTQATADGALYRNLLERYGTTVRILTQVAPELVQIAEEGSQHTPHSREVIASRLDPLLQAGADQIALACTHFPFLQDVIAEIAGEGVHLIDPAPAVARQVARVLPDGLRGNPQPERRYYTSGDAQAFARILAHLPGMHSAEVCAVTAFPPQDVRRE